MVSPDGDILTDGGNDLVGEVPDLPDYTACSDAFPVDISAWTKNTNLSTSPLSPYWGATGNMLWVNAQFSPTYDLYVDSDCVLGFGGEFDVQIKSNPSIAVLSRAGLAVLNYTKTAWVARVYYFSDNQTAVGEENGGSSTSVTGVGGAYWQRITRDANDIIRLYSKSTAGGAWVLRHTTGAQSGILMVAAYGVASYHTFGGTQANAWDDFVVNSHD